MDTIRVICMTAGCTRSFLISPLHPDFPRGPFQCPTCMARRHVEGGPGIPDDDHVVTIDELDAEGAVASVVVKIPEKR